MSVPFLGSAPIDVTARAWTATTCDSAKPAPIPTTKVIAINVATNAGRSRLSEAAIRLVVIEVPPDGGLPAGPSHRSSLDRDLRGRSDLHHTRRRRMDSRLRHCFRTFSSSGCQRASTATDPWVGAWTVEIAQTQVSTGT